MQDEEFRKLYCWLVESVKPPMKVVERILKNILNALNENQTKRKLTCVEYKKIQKGNKNGM